MRRRSRAEHQLSPVPTEASNFEQCAVKKITLETFVAVPGKRPTDDDWLELSQDPMSDPRSPEGYKARVECPRTEDDGIVIASANRAGRPEIAVEELGELAGLIACNGCAYACASPSRVSEMRGEWAANEAIRVVNQHTLNQARLEVEQAEQQVLGTGSVAALPPAASP